MQGEARGGCRGKGWGGRWGQGLLPAAFVWSLFTASCILVKSTAVMPGENDIARADFQGLWSGISPKRRPAFTAALDLHS